MAETSEMVDLGTPYRPAMVYLPDADIAEYVTTDCACIYEEIGDGAALIRDMQTREVIGFRIRDPRAWAQSTTTCAPSDLKPLIEAYVACSFKKLGITSVEVGDVYGADDEPVFDIRVAVNGTPVQIARAEPSGFLSGIRSLVARVGAFPLVHLRSSG